MSDSPASPTPYEVLGVSISATTDDLRRAYRLRLRQTHPDTGGNAARFHEVQLAWALIGDPVHRAAYDAGRQSRVFEPEPRPTGSAGYTSAFHPRAESSSPRARSYGHPGGRSRERFLSLMREWVGRGIPLDDPYDPSLVRRAPREIRQALAKALAEEATAKEVSALGIGYTVWNAVAAGGRSGGRIDHIVLGPAGLFAVASEDWGSEVRLTRGEVVGEGVDAESEPLHTLGRNAKALSRALRVRFTGLIIVVPDNDLGEAFQQVERGRYAGAVLIRRSLLPDLLRNGISIDGRVSVDRVFEVRTRVQEGVRFV
jgi:molecular chaperone DnaJ